MTQIKFTMGDVDLLKQAARILQEISKQITEFLHDAPHSHRTTNAYDSARHTYEIGNTLLNWSAALEGRALAEIMEGKARLQRSYSSHPEQH